MIPSEEPSARAPAADTTTRSREPHEGPSLPPTVHLPSWVQAPTGPAWPDGHVFLDDFQVEGILGQGGMGGVYPACQLSTNKRLPAKRTRLLDASGRRRFLAELQTWIDLP